MYLGELSLAWTCIQDKNMTWGYSPTVTQAVSNLYIDTSKNLQLSLPTNIQGPFQGPKLEVPTMYKAYFSGLCQAISPQNMANNMVQDLHIRVLNVSLKYDIPAKRKPGNKTRSGFFW
jgi:hypothetical protein